VLLIRARDAEGSASRPESTLDSIRLRSLGKREFSIASESATQRTCIGMALRYWKGRGVTVYDGEARAHTKKVWLCPHRVPWFTMSRYQMSAHYGTSSQYVCAQTEISWLVAWGAQPARRCDHLINNAIFSYRCRIVRAGCAPHAPPRNFCLRANYCEPRPVVRRQSDSATS